MNLVKTLLSVIIFSFLSACNSGSQFPVEKRYWTPEDYDDVIWKITYKTPKGTQYPRFSNPETALVIQKLVDPQNYQVVVDDKELGLNYRNELSEKFFNAYRDMSEVYSAMDIQDKYIYAEELVAIEKFGLGIQIRYFRLGNDRIVAQADAPESDRTKAVIESNEQTVIRNFNLYLDNINDERYYGPHAHLLADGITSYFFELVEAFPTANFAEMIKKARLMAKKTEVDATKTALTQLIQKLESKKLPV